MNDREYGVGIDPRDHIEADVPVFDGDPTLCTVCRDSVLLGIDIELPDGSHVCRWCESELFAGCRYCGEHVDPVDGIDPYGDGDPVHRRCEDDWRISESEAANERYVEDAHDGACPRGADERRQAEATWKRTND